MRKLSLLLCFLCISACAAAHNIYTSGTTARTPASSIDEENLEISFFNLMSAQDPAQEFLDYLNRVKNIYLRTEAYLSDFDVELEAAGDAGRPFSLEDSASYKKILTMWTLSHRLETKIEYHYLRLLEIRYDKQANPRDRELAKKILVGFHKGLKSPEPIDRLATEELKKILREAVKKALAARRGVTPEVDPGFRSSDEELTTLRAYRARLRLLGTRENLKNDELSQEIQETSAKIELRGSPGREPQSEPIFYPSTGPNGNIFGKVFPKNVWALTYDDGPHPTYTAQALANLEALNLKATFFWLAQNVLLYPNMVKLAGDKNMARENHSWTHPQLPKLGPAALDKEIVQSTATEEKAYGDKIRFFRCPYGAGVSVTNIRKMIADLGLIHVFWSVDTLDWQDKDPSSILARAQKQMAAQGRGVILFHDVHPQSIAASKMLLEWSQKLKGTPQEIRWVTIPEIVDEMNAAASGSAQK